MSDQRRGRKRFRGPRRWHRFLGAVFALPLLWLCVTGLLLQHQERLGLTEAQVSSGWLLQRYGQIPDGAPRSATAGRFTVAEWDGVLFRDGEVLDASGSLVGAVAHPAELVVATRRELLVYDAQGAFVDRLGEESLPGETIERIGSRGTGTLLVESAGGVHALSADLLSHEEVRREDVGEVAWSEVRDDPDLRAGLQAALAEGAGFTWSRVITDLHSGSLFGVAGRFLVDLTAIGVIVLTLFGVRLLFRRT